MAAEVEEDDFLLAPPLGLEGFLDGRGDGMGGFGRGKDAFGLVEELPGLENALLPVCPRLDDPQGNEMADQGSHPVVAEPAGMDGRGDEIHPQGVHVEEGRHTGRIAVVVAKGAPRERRASLGLDGDEADLLPLLEIPADEREGQSAEIRPAADAANDDVRFGPGR